MQKWYPLAFRHIAIKGKEGRMKHFVQDARPSTYSELFVATRPQMQRYMTTDWWKYPSSTEPYPGTRKAVTGAFQWANAPKDLAFQTFISLRAQWCRMTQTQVASTSWRGSTTAPTTMCRECHTCFFSVDQVNAAVKQIVRDYMAGNGTVSVTY